MDLDRADVVLVKRTCAMVQSLAGVVTQLFYARLFELSPEARTLFTRNMANQRAKFMTTLNFMVEALDQPQTLQTTAARLGRDHARYQVLDVHYDVVGEALLWALAETLGPAYTPEVEAAWTRVYTLLADLMKGAARQPFTGLPSPIEPEF